MLKHYPALDIMKTINILIIITYLISLLFLVQSASALIAESENYSVARFGVGVQAIDLESDSLTGRSVLVANAGTRAAESDAYLANIGFLGKYILLYNS